MANSIKFLNRTLQGRAGHPWWWTSSLMFLFAITLGFMVNPSTANAWSRAGKLPPHPPGPKIDVPSYVIEQLRDALVNPLPREVNGKWSHSETPPKDLNKQNQSAQTNDLTSSYIKPPPLKTEPEDFTKFYSELFTESYSEIYAETYLKTKAILENKEYLIWQRFPDGRFKAVSKFEDLTQYNRHNEGLTKVIVEANTVYRPKNNGDMIQSLNELNQNLPSSPSLSDVQAIAVETVPNGTALLIELKPLPEQQGDFIGGVNLDEIIREIDKTEFNR